MIIYKITNKSNGKIYIGQTIHTLNYRKNQHLKCARKHIDNCRLLNNALRKYPLDNFTWEVIATATTQDELNSLENYYINLYDSMNRSKGYNLTSGGRKPILSEETKKKIGDSQRGHLNHMYGIKGSKHHSSIKVYNVTDDIYYDRATMCSEQTGLSISKICAVCRGDRATTGNKVFRYIINGKIQDVVPKTKKKSKSVKNVDTGEIFETIKDAEIKYYGKPNGSIAKACKTGGYARGYWKIIK